VNLVRDTGCAQRVQIKGDLLVVAWGWRFSATDGQGRADSLVTGRERTTDGGLVSVQTRRQAYMELHGATLELGLPASPRWLLASPLLQVSGDGTLRALGASGSLVGADTGDDAGASGPVAPVELRGGTLSLLPQGERLAGPRHGGAVAAQPQAALAVPLGAPPLLLLALGLPGLVLAAALAVRARRQAHRLVVRPGGPALQEARSAFLALYASLPAATPALAPAPLPAPAA
jgi:hypothetical protein